MLQTVTFHYKLKHKIEPCKMFNFNTQAQITVLTNKQNCQIDLLCHDWFKNIPIIFTQTFHLSI